MEKRKNILNIEQLLFLGIYIMALFIPYIRGIGGTHISAWICILKYIILGIGSIFIFRELYIDGVNNWKKNITKGFMIIIVVLIIDLISTVIAQIPLELIAPDYTVSNENNILKIFNVIPNKFLLVMAIGIFGPIVEEIIFRGILVGKLKQKLPKYICVMISSILFMLIHVHVFRFEELLYYLPVLFTGIIYSITYIKTNNILLCMLLHILNNLPAIVMLSLTV